MGSRTTDTSTRAWQNQRIKHKTYLNVSRSTSMVVVRNYDNDIIYRFIWAALSSALSCDKRTKNCYLLLLLRNKKNIVYLVFYSWFLPVAFASQTIMFFVTSSFYFSTNIFFLDTFMFYVISILVFSYQNEAHSSSQ